MNTTLYYSALVLHLTGVALLAGAAILDYVFVRRMFVTRYSDQHSKSSDLQFIHRLGPFLAIGGLLMILSGLTMIFTSGGVWEKQLWFKVKMGLVLLVLLNAIVLRHKALGSIKPVQLQTNAGIGDSQWSGNKLTLTISQTVQLILLLTIFVLSVFKFN